MPTGLRGRTSAPDDGDDGWGPADESDLMMAGPDADDSMLADQPSTRAGPSQARFSEEVDAGSHDEKPHKNGGKRGNRFSLFVAPKPAEDDVEDDYEPKMRAIETKNEAGTRAESTQAELKQQAHASRVEDKDRDEQLRASLFELRNMNDVFDGFLEALESAKGHNEVGSQTIGERRGLLLTCHLLQRLAQRTQHTSALLDHYISLLGQAEHTQRLVLNERWKGASAVSLEDRGCLPALLKQVLLRTQHICKRCSSVKLPSWKRRGSVWKGSVRQQKADQGRQASARLASKRLQAVCRHVVCRRLSAAEGHEVRRAPAQAIRLLRANKATVTSTTRRPGVEGTGASEQSSTTTSGLRKPSAGIRSSGYGPKGRT